MSDIDANDERVMLDDFLDRYRGVVERKVAGLSLEQATSVSTPTGMTLLGVVQHLWWVERVWFAHHLNGEPADDLGGSALGVRDTDHALDPGPCDRGDGSPRGSRHPPRDDRWATGV